ncbi:Hypothetical predicted protein [Marmota monax]|uniref:Uncharacterized protein n=1 Tax=Marmota monax TaxID=9995 RepID=A0A5E4A9R4_MARMO|nr:hypothetical protein GHT09_004075 [Marmota monax]VTJ54037.1 Hypothetical predicted protein [Marmota monax]
MQRAGEASDRGSSPWDGWRGQRGTSRAPATCTHTCRAGETASTPPLCLSLDPTGLGHPRGGACRGRGQGRGQPEGRAARRRRGGRKGGGTQGRRRPERARCGKPVKRGQRRGETGKEKWRD